MKKLIQIVLIGVFIFSMFLLILLGLMFVKPLIEPSKKLNDLEVLKNITITIYCESEKNALLYFLQKGEYLPLSSVIDCAIIEVDPKKYDEPLKKYGICIVLNETLRVGGCE